MKNNSKRNDRGLRKLSKRLTEKQKNNRKNKIEIKKTGKLNKVRIELEKIDRTMAWLARQVNIQHSQLTNYDRDKQPLAYYHQIHIANIFKGVTIEELFDES